MDPKGLWVLLRLTSSTIRNKGNTADEPNVMHPKVDTIKWEPKQQKDTQGCKDDRHDESFIAEIEKDFEVVMERGTNKFLKSK